MVCLIWIVILALVSFVAGGIFGQKLWTKGSEWLKGRIN